MSLLMVKTLIKYFLQHKPKFDDPGLGSCQAFCVRISGKSMIPPLGVLDYLFVTLVMTN